MSSRTVVLLGAGASADAGLPLTSRLAELIVEDANTTSRPNDPIVRTLNFVYGAMVGQQGDDGGNPLTAVNIEKLISAVRLLQAREGHEVAPFVSSWKQGAYGFGRNVASSRRVREVESGVGDLFSKHHSNGSKLVEAIADIARDITKPQSDSVFKKVESLLLSGIRAKLSALGDVGYLHPLGDLARTQAGGLEIVTLNYDLGIETMAAEMSIDLDTGIDRWRPGVPMDFELAEGRLNLYKLHGSLNWAVQNPRDSLIQAPTIRVVGSDSESLPWIVVGDREKLATDGPTLDLLHAASRALARADHLVVIGYSFADNHINAMIRDWMAADAARTVTTLDPYWPDFSGSDPRARIASHYGGGDSYNVEGKEPRLLPIRAGTKEALSRALTEFPSRVDPYVESSIEWTPSGPRVKFKLLGPGLDGVSVWSEGDFAVAGSVFTSEEARLAPPENMWGGQSRSSAKFGTVGQGEEFLVFPEVRAETSVLRLRVQGHTLSGERHVKVELAIPPGPDEIVLADS